MTWPAPCCGDVAVVGLAGSVLYSVLLMSFLTNARSYRIVPHTYPVRRHKVKLISCVILVFGNVKSEHVRATRER